MLSGMNGEQILLPECFATLCACKRLRALMQSDVMAELLRRRKLLFAAWIGAEVRALVGRVRGEYVAAQIVAARVGLRTRGIRAFVWALVCVGADVPGEMATYREGTGAMRTGVSGLFARHSTSERFLIGQT